MFLPVFFTALSNGVFISGVNAGLRSLSAMDFEVAYSPAPMSAHTHTHTQKPIHQPLDSSSKHSKKHIARGEVKAHAQQPGLICQLSFRE